MFFVLFGTRPSVSETAIVRFVCHFCGIDAPQRVFKRSAKFTLFFVPLFSFGTKHAVACTNCGATTELTSHQSRDAERWAENRGAEHA